LGKQKLGSDIPNGKRTLMVVHALSHINDKSRKKMIGIIGNEKATQNDIIEVIDIFRENGSIDYAQNKLEEFRKKAKICLDALEESESKKMLTALADYSVTRNY